MKWRANRSFVCLYICCCFFNFIFSKCPFWNAAQAVTRLHFESSTLWRRQQNMIRVSVCRLCNVVPAFSWCSVSHYRELTVIHCSYPTANRTFFYLLPPVTNIFQRTEAVCKETNINTSPWTFHGCCVRVSPVFFKKIFCMYCLPSTLKYYFLCIACLLL